MSSSILAQIARELSFPLMIDDAPLLTFPDAVGDIPPCEIYEEDMMSVPADTAQSIEPNATPAREPDVYHEIHADGSFLAAIGDWAGSFLSGPGCDPDRIVAADVATVAAYMAGYDATVTSRTFAETLRNAMAQR